MYAKQKQDIPEALFLRVLQFQRLLGHLSHRLCQSVPASETYCSTACPQEVVYSSIYVPSFLVSHRPRAIQVHLFVHYHPNKCLVSVYSELCLFFFTAQPHPPFLPSFRALQKFHSSPVWDHNILLHYDGDIVWISFYSSRKFSGYEYSFNLYALTLSPGSPGVPGFPCLPGGP